MIGRIRAGEVYQLNLCTRLTAALHEPPLDLFVRHRRRGLSPAYGAHLPTGADTTVVSLSPERFLTVSDGEVITSPIKGTTKRSRRPGRLAAALVDQGRRREHHDHRPDAQRPVPGLRAGQRGGDRAPGGAATPGVWHLVSTVTGRLAPECVAADLLAATFPPGSVTGAPKSSAVRAIAAEEARCPRRLHRRGRTGHCRRAGPSSAC